jgi:hypothetical protein
VEVLHRFKANHELWVEESLSSLDAAKEAADRLYATLIDGAVMHCNLKNWIAWTEGPLSPKSRWRWASIQGIHEFREMTLLAPWPGYRPALEAAIRRFSYCLSEAEALLGDDVDEIKLETYEVSQTHRRFEGTSTYWDELSKYRRRVCDIHGWLVEATKAGNWLCDIVRAEINPYFLLESGKLAVAGILVDKPGDNIGIPQYRSEDIERFMISDRGGPTTVFAFEDNES